MYCTCKIFFIFLVLTGTIYLRHTAGLKNMYNVDDASFSPEHQEISPSFLRLSRYSGLIVHFLNYRTPGTLKNDNRHSGSATLAYIPMLQPCDTDVRYDLSWPKKVTGTPAML